MKFVKCKRGMGIGSRDMRFEWCDLRFVMFCVVNVPISCRVLERLENGRLSAGSKPRNALPVERTRRELMSPKLKVYFVNSGRLGSCPKPHLGCYHYLRTLT